MTLARPETRYAEADGVRIGYQCFGSGKRTLIETPGFAQNIDVIWENAEAAAFFERLGSMCRVIIFDKRGTGVSDRGIPPPSLDARVQDLVAVMRAEAVDRAIIGGFSEGGTLAAFFAATYPERTEGLILSGAFAGFIRRNDHPWAPTARRANDHQSSRQIHLGHRLRLGEGVRPVHGRATRFPALGSPLRTRIDISLETGPVRTITRRHRYPPRAGRHLRSHACHALSRGPHRPVPERPVSG